MMKQYSIEFFSVKRSGEEWRLSLEFQREHFSSYAYRTYLITSLFDLAAEGAQNKHLVAYVRRDGEKILTARCDTVVDGSKITAYLKAARPREVYWPVRAMVIAE